MQNVVPVLDGPAETQANPEQKLQEQEKRIEISCALAAEASRRSRLLSGEEACQAEEPGQPLSDLWPLFDPLWLSPTLSTLTVPHCLKTHTSELRWHMAFRAVQEKTNVNL